jgi:hypothetical protein
MERKKIERPKALDSDPKTKFEGYVRKPRPKRYTTRQDFDFLTNIRMVMRYICDYYEVSRPELELLLYLYGKVLFTRKCYNEFNKIIGIDKDVRFKHYMDKGLIIEWRKASGSYHALYSLSNKAKTICTEAHKICVGDRCIPEGYFEKMKGSEKTIDFYYMQIAKKLNRENRSIKKQKGDS